MAGRPHQSPARFVGKVTLALIAVAAVVVLALVGVHAHSHKAITTVTPTTRGDAANPDLAKTNVPAKTVTYSNTTVQIASGGMTRSYLVSRPATNASTKKLPVIVVLHGRSVTPSYEQQRTALPRVVAPSILVYPAGYDETWDAGNCCAQAQQAKINDVAFVQQVIAQVKQRQPDAAQGPVYLLGYSNGGKLALDLACQDAKDFAAIAVYGATDAASCASRPPADLLIMGGTDDTEIPPGNTPPPVETDGFQPPSIAQEVQEYRDADGCTPQAVVTSVGSVSLTTWTHCQANSRMGEAVFTGQSHNWPQGTATSPSGGGVAWAWFSALGA